MKLIKTLLTASIITATVVTSQIASAHQADDHKLAQAIAGEHRSDKNSARDQFRHPKETLDFFGFHSKMTVVELTPGGGWYTEILAPALKGSGKLVGAHYPDTGADDYYSKSRKKLEKKLASNPVFSEVTLVDFDPKKDNKYTPAGTADLVLTFRNLHNWKDAGMKQVFKDAYKSLKTGGVLGVVEHRMPSTQDWKTNKRSGYVPQELVVEYAKAAGFTLAASSNINANAKDSADHPKGVWSLPPVLALGEKDKEKYLAIGESDRMTLKFVK